MYSLNFKQKLKVDEKFIFSKLGLIVELLTFNSETENIRAGQKSI